MSVFQSTGFPEAASRLFDLPEFHVSDVIVDDEGGRTVTIGTGVTEAANTTIKHIKRIGRGYRNHDNYACRILITSAARTAT